MTCLLQDIKPTKGDMLHEKNNVLEFARRDVILDPLIALFRSGAQQLITQTVEAELEELLDQHSGRRTDDCNAAVARNGHLPERDLETGLGLSLIHI